MVRPVESWSKARHDGKGASDLAPNGRTIRASVVRRREEILALLKTQGSVSVTDLAERLQCSLATIRRDLQELQESAGLRRFHGAVAVDGIGMEGEFQDRLAVAEDEKRAIARVVVEQLKPGQVIGLNGGTTTTQIAHHIAEAELEVTVVTNAINIAFALAASRVPVVVVGGVLRSANYETTGPLALRVLEHLHLDWAVLGANGVDPRFGASTHTESEAAVGQAFAQRADRVVLAVDHSKLGSTALFRMVDWGTVAAIACDGGGTDILMRWALEQEATPDAEAGYWHVRHRLNT